MAITLADFTKIWASTSPLTPYSFSDANYQEGWNFVGATPPARQMWDSIQKNNDEKLKYIVDNFLPLSGGTMTGDLTLQNGSKAVSEEDVYYKAGDTLTLGTIYTTGLVTAGAKDMRVSVWTPKSMKNVGVTLTALTGGIRTVTGSYIETDGTNLYTKYECSASKLADNMLNLYLLSTNALSVTNNTPIAFAMSLTVSFT